METTLESRAAQFVQMGNFGKAISVYTEALENLHPRLNSKDYLQQAILVLLSRAGCYTKVKDHDAALADYNQVLKLDKKNVRGHMKKVKNLTNHGRFDEAMAAAIDWIKACPDSSSAKKEIERLNTLLNTLQDQEEEEDIAALAAGQDKSENDLGGDASRDSNSVEKSPTKRTNSTLRKQYSWQDYTVKPVLPERKWKYRDPPRGLTSEDYSKCPRFYGTGQCRFGNKCSLAHSNDELAEWKSRFEQKRKHAQQERECGNTGAGSTYAEQLTAKWMSAPNPSSVMTNSLPGVKVHVNSDLSITMPSKKCTHAWLFTITSKFHLQRVCLLDEAVHSHFHVTSVTVGPKKNQLHQKLPDHCQDWKNASEPNLKNKNETVFRVKVLFKTEIYGTFRQTVVFDFGSEPVLCQQLCADLSPVSDIEKTVKDFSVNETGRWDLAKKTVIEFEPKTIVLEKEDQQLLETYPPPSATELLADPALQQSSTHSGNYIQRMHSLLSIEEMAQFSSIARYNVKTHIKLIDRFMLTHAVHSVPKAAGPGELFAHIKMNSDISEDTGHGRLIQQNVNSVMIAINGIGDDFPLDPSTVYEALIEDKAKDFIMLRLSAKCVKDLDLQMDEEIEYPAQVQFQLNRLPFCELHFALDRLPDNNIVFPEMSTILEDPFDFNSEWKYEPDSRLNAKQKEAIKAIATRLPGPIPPILLTGPYGTGKTFTLANAVKEILQTPGTRVLVCTHSNSAADLYIREYFHSFVDQGLAAAKPLRIMYTGRWIQTVSAVVMQYCLIDTKDGISEFRAPKKEDVDKHRVVVSTLTTTKYFHKLGLDRDTFSHILIDEAAQAYECETNLPIALAGPRTTVVLAGDHMQMSPEVYSEFARQHSFQISLLERLFDLYPREHPCKLLLCENYRSHKAIIDFTSELFYDNKLIGSGDQPVHDTWYPLTFFTTLGEDIQHTNSTGFFNNAEVYEIIERVLEMEKNWPKAWGSFDGSGIGVVVPYADQVVRIRAELRKKKLFGVSVERVFNVQGKQFRVIIISTVRTNHTCSLESTDDDVDYGFLSNAKLLNTAITRAQSLVAVVGDPVSLCTVGKCRKVWETFLEICYKNNSLIGMSWTDLREQIDGIELKKTYGLNPLAPEFVPKMPAYQPFDDQNPYMPDFAQQLSPTGMPPLPMPQMSGSPPTMAEMAAMQSYFSNQLPVNSIPQIPTAPYANMPWIPPLLQGNPYLLNRHPRLPPAMWGMDPNFGYQHMMAPHAVAGLVPPGSMSPQSFSPNSNSPTGSKNRRGQICAICASIGRTTPCGKNCPNRRVAPNAVFNGQQQQQQQPLSRAQLNFVQSLQKHEANNVQGHAPESRLAGDISPQVLMNNSNLRDEFFHYIQKKEGDEEAQKFLKNLQEFSSNTPTVKNKENDKMVNQNGTSEAASATPSPIPTPIINAPRMHSPHGAIRHPQAPNQIIPGMQFPPQRMPAPNGNQHHPRPPQWLSQLQHKDMMPAQHPLHHAGQRRIYHERSPRHKNQHPHFSNVMQDSTGHLTVNKNNTATVNVGNFFEAERPRSAESDVGMSEFLPDDPEAPLAIDQVMRYIEDGIECNDDSMNGRPTYANILQRGGEQQPNAQHQQHQQAAYLHGNGPTRPSAIPRRGLGNDAHHPYHRNWQLLDQQAQQQSDVQIQLQHQQQPRFPPGGYQRELNTFQRMPPPGPMNIPPPSMAAEGEDAQDPLEILKNLNIKASPATQALYQYFS